MAVSQMDATKLLDTQEQLPKELEGPAAEADWGHPGIRKHVVSRLIHEGALAGHMYPQADEFYAGGKTMKAVEDFARDAYGFTEPHHHVLHKALLALTSGGLNPKTNFEAVDSMIREGRARGHGFLGIPERNEPAYREWITKWGLNPDELEKPWEAGAHFFEQHMLGKPPKAMQDPGYQSTVAVLHNKSGKIIAVEQGGAWHYLGGWTARKIKGAKERDPKSLKKVDIPLVVNGQGIVAKNWTLRGEQVIKGLQNIQTLIHNHGEEGAAHWLTTTHDPLGLPESYHAPGEPKEGAFILGPKFGPFMLNLVGPQFAHHLTSDMWHARTMNRYLKQSTGVKGPRNEKERAHWWGMMKDAAGALGISVASLQSRLWSYEQGLHKALGVNNIDTKTYEDGKNAVIRKIHPDSGRPV